MPYDYMDEAAQRGNALLGTTVTSGVAWRGVVGGRPITIYGDTPITDAQAMERLQTNHNWRNVGGKVGGITQTHDNPEFYAAINPNATAEQLAQQARDYKQHQLDIIPGGKKGFRGWQRQNPLGVIGLFAGAAAGGAALTGGFGGAGGAAASSGAAPGAAPGVAGGGGIGSGGIGAGFGTNPGGLGIFANGGTAGIGTVGTGNAGLLASTGGIGGGAGIGGTAGGALGGLSRFANSVSGVGGNMGWNWDTIFDYGVPLVGSLLEADGAKDASRASAAATAAAIAENRRQFDTSREDMLPWLTAGRGALGRLENPQASFTASPGYEFVRDEGTRGIQNSFAARGGALSGNALRALTEFSGNVASGEYNNWWNQQAGLAGIGQTSAQNLGVLGANNAANVGGLLQDRGNARASGITGQTNAYTNLLQNILSTRNRRNGLAA